MFKSQDMATQGYDRASVIYIHLYVADAASPDWPRPNIEISRNLSSNDRLRGMWRRGDAIGVPLQELMVVYVGYIEFHQNEFHGPE